ncbi:MAG: chemotaxis protein CheW, partial [Myxococcota bacterium]
MTTLPSTEGVSGPWVLCRVADNLVGIEASAVRSMVQLPEVTNVPHTPDHVRGVMNLRGRVLRVVDLRTQLGFASLTEETAKFLEALEHHEEDHKRWLDKLQEGAAVGEVH